MEFGVRRFGCGIYFLVEGFWVSSKVVIVIGRLEYIVGIMLVF